MEFNPIELIRDLMHAEGINFRWMELPLDNIQRFDGGLRGQIYADYDYSDLRQHLIGHCQDQTLYIFTDQFELRTIIMRDSRPTATGDGALIVIGPYIIRSAEQILPEIIERNNLPVFLHIELRTYFSGVPFVSEPSSLEAEVGVLAKFIFNSLHFQIDRTGLDLDISSRAADLQAEPHKTLSMAMIEERYKNEDALLEAMSRGDMQTAMLHMAAFRKFAIEQRNTDLLRNSKNFMHVLNTLLRKAVQTADVHPAHIDSTSTYFHLMIEATRTIEDMTRISPEMIRKYCLLVQNHSLRAYSKTIQRVINHVDFHLAEPLSLTALAEIAKVNPSYLSTQFKKETGQNLTDHINQKRVQKSLFLLNTTELPVHVIAERVGILDENYFSRLFKKVQGKSPREYRKSLNI